MNRLFTIAVREYLAYVKTIGFWLSMLTAPMIIALSAGAPILMARSTPPPTVAVIETARSPVSGGQHPIASVTRRLVQSGALIVAVPSEVASAVTPEAQRAALAVYFGDNGPPLRTIGPNGGAVLDRPLDYAVFLTAEGEASANNLASVRPVTVRIWSRIIGSNAIRGTVELAVGDWTRDLQLQVLGVTQAQSRQILDAEPNVETYSTRAAQGEVSFRDRLPGIAGFVMGIALWSAAMTGAGILLNSVIEEKSSRILEVLLTSASVPEIMGGKILGVAAVTSTVLGLWTAIGGGVLLAMNPSVAADLSVVLFSHGLIFYFLFYFLAGYVMYATLFITVGAFCETSREAQTLLGPMMIVLIIPMLFLTQAITNPDSPILRVLSWIPTFTPFLMAARAATDPPVWEIFGTGALLLATIAAEVWLAGRAFRAGALSTSRFELRHFFASLAGRGAG